MKERETTIIRPRVGASAWALVLLCLFAACQRDSSRSSKAQRQLHAAQARWTSSGIVDYTMRQQVSCACPEEQVRPVDVHVQGGVIVSVDDAATGDPVDPDLARSFLTVEGLFALVQEAIDTRAARIDASYDKDVGFPSVVGIDYFLSAADDEIGFHVSMLRVTGSSGRVAEVPYRVVRIVTGEETRETGDFGPSRVD